VMNDAEVQHQGRELSPKEPSKPSKVNHMQFSLNKCSDFVL
jgi:hypothetical protein